MKNFEKNRHEMVERQIRRRGIKNERILNAMETVPRHEFVPQMHRHLAYEDRPLPIGEDQTISQPYIVAMMTELINPGKDERILEIGTGSGYQAAVLSRLAAEVFTIERHAPLVEKAREAIDRAGYDNIHIYQGDGSKGLPDEAPFDAIIITAAAPKVPQPLIDQLRNGGRLVIPVGTRQGQTLQRVIKNEAGELEYDDLIPVAFVPLRGEHGWQSHDW